MATKGPRRTGRNSGRKLIGDGAAGRAGDKIHNTGAKRGTQRSKQMDDIMGGLAAGRRKKK